jgi:ABC-type multidrug transport system ATPase subunit
LKAESGQTIALVGPTGAGKTTIVNLLTRFYDIQDGSIKIDGLDIRKIRKDDLRTRLGIVLQDVFLFSGTVMDNIRYGRLDATDEECMQAAKFANADGFIKRLPRGYATELSERAGNLSHGQRQLISIARTLVADPDILVLDEATSSVDTRTEIQIQEAFQRLMRGRTSFVIAHRLSTIRRADMVLVINDGEIIERGTHRELLEKKGFYHRIYMSQFKGTNGKADHIKLTPPERPTPRFPPQGIPDMFLERILKVVKVFKERGATSPEKALPLKDLGLPPMFSMMMQGPMGQSGLFVEKNGKYYLNEERLKQMHLKN